MMWNYGWHGMMGYYGPFGFGGVLSWVFMLLFWILVVALIVAVVRGIRGPYGYWHGMQNLRDEKTPLDILKERYAKGEINKEEFEQKKKDLS